MRRIADLERALREVVPSVARSIAPTVARLDAQAADLAAKQVTLDAQQATLTTTVAGLTTAQATLATAVTDIAANVASINAIIGNEVLVGSAAAEFGMSSAFPLSGSPGAPTTLITLNVLVPAGVTKAIATTSIVPAIYTASGTGSFTATVESSLIAGGAGAYSYAGEIVDVVGAATSALTVTKPIVLASVTPGAIITMRATAYASGVGCLAEGDGSLSILFLR
jgi:hypothetical protein